MKPLAATSDCGYNKQPQRTNNKQKVNNWE